MRRREALEKNSFGRRIYAHKKKTFGRILFFRAAVISPAAEIRERTKGEKGAGSVRISKRPEERREEFLDAAQALFYEQGIEATSVQQIVKRVGVAQGLYYYYFHSKKEIVEAVIVRLADRFEEELCRFVSTVKGSFHERFGAFLDACFSAYREFVQSKKWTDLLRESAIIGQMSIRIKAIVSSQLAELVKEGIAKGELALPFPEQYVRVVVSGVGDLLLEGEQDLKMIRALMIEMVEGPPACLPVKEGAAG